MFHLVQKALSIRVLECCWCCWSGTTKAFIHSLGTPKISRRFPSLQTEQLDDLLGHNLPELERQNDESEHQNVAINHYTFDRLMGGRQKPSRLPACRQYISSCLLDIFPRRKDAVFTYSDFAWFLNNATIFLNLPDIMSDWRPFWDPGMTAWGCTELKKRAEEANSRSWRNGELLWLVHLTRSGTAAQRGRMPHREELVLTFSTAGFWPDWSPIQTDWYCEARWPVGLLTLC